MDDLEKWMNLSWARGYIWYVKRLSGNDTLANGAKQYGPYISREFLFRLYPQINAPEIENPDIRLLLDVDSHGERREIRAVWYNNRLHTNPRSGRNETRLTGFGGKASALLNPDNTGALTVFAFQPVTGPYTACCRIWVCRNPDEERLVEDRIGPIEPGTWQIWPPPRHIPARSNIRLTEFDIPAAWRKQFPTSVEIIHKAIELRSNRNLNADKRLMRRREYEFEIFRRVEQAIEQPHIQAGFVNIDDFIARAQTILQRRKVRSGHSLELHTKAIFEEEQLKEGVNFSHQSISENKKKPDFLFPSAAAYCNPNFPAERLRMLALKTTCRDRWRQILNEADRIPAKHLLTLQEGISETQFTEMQHARVQLVVPAELKPKFPPQVQPHLQTLEEFIAEVRQLPMIT